MNYKTILPLTAAGLIVVAGISTAALRQPAKAAAPANASPSENTAPVRRPPLVIPAGTTLHVRLNQAIGTRTNRPGDRFGATLESPVVADGRTIVPQGTQVTGVVRESLPSGRFKGRAVLMLALDGIDVNGQHIPIATSPVTRESDRHRKRNLMWIGGGSGTGALIGGLAGGPAGLGIGLGAGAAAGTTTAMLSGRKQVRMPAEMMVSFRLGSAVTVRS